ncbi:hypothetical protein E2C01_055419 [Portunus trituberculatus]|uniref:Uncharacterized protein n=1 Tax=Portunus trituberculatus TaxID=210409 RepID=A0A5B7GUY2_PORTR|nr:hypothetical protein [Portunus trituberculatus]
MQYITQTSGAPGFPATVRWSLIDPRQQAAHKETQQGQCKEIIFFTFRDYKDNQPILPSYIKKKKKEKPSRHNILPIPDHLPLHVSQAPHLCRRTSPRSMEGERHERHTNNSPSSTPTHTGAVVERGALM